MKPVGTLRVGVGVADALAREFSTKSRTLKRVKGTRDLVVEISAITKDKTFLKLKELRFLHYLRPFFVDIESGNMTFDIAVEKASAEAGVELKWAKGYLSSSRYRRWMEDRVEEAAVRAGVTVEYLMSKHVANIEGRAKFSLSQLQSLDQLGERIWPKTQRIEHQVEAKDSRGMDEMMKVREDVEALERKLKQAIEPPELKEMA